MMKGVHEEERAKHSQACASFIVSTQALHSGRIMNYHETRRLVNARGAVYATIRRNQSYSPFHRKITPPPLSPGDRKSGCISESACASAGSINDAPTAIRRRFA
jgi:hypothetical protein